MKLDSVEEEQKLKASYVVLQCIAKCKKVHSIGEHLIWAVKVDVWNYLLAENAKIKYENSFKVNVKHGR